MNATIRGIVESIALMVEGKDNPIRMVRLTLCVPTESEHDADEAAGPRIAKMAYSPAFESENHVLGYSKIKPTVAMGAHNITFDDGATRLLCKPVVHEIRADVTIDIVYRISFPLAGNQTSLIYLAENLGDQITCTLSVAQQELPLEKMSAAERRILSAQTKNTVERLRSKDGVTSISFSRRINGRQIGDEVTLSPKPVAG